MFLVIVLSILFAIDAYSLWKWSRFVKRSDLPAYFSKSAWVISILMLISIAFYASMRYYNPLFASEIGILHNITTVWYMPKLLLMPFFIIIDIFKLIKKGLVYLNQPHQHEKIKMMKKEKADNSRRKFARNVGLTISSVPFIIVSKGSFDSVTDPRVHKAEIPIKDLPDAFEGLKIAQISDVHTGSFRSAKMFRDVVQIINEHKPDIFVNTGDFVNFNPEELALFQDEWKKFKPDIGVYSCLGNHDHYMTDEEHTTLINYLNDLDQNLLMNENQVIERRGKRLVIAGIDNLGMGQDYGDIDKAFAGIDSTDPVIFLCHDPTNWDSRIRNQRKVDLMLSGHTHGGQFGFTIRGKQYSPAAFRYNQWAGLYRDKDQHLYINRGLGTSGFPVRIGMNPEITILTLRKSNAV